MTWLRSGGGMKVQPLQVRVQQSLNTLLSDLPMAYQSLRGTLFRSQPKDGVPIVGTACSLAQFSAQSVAHADA